MYVANKYSTLTVCIVLTWWLVTGDWWLVTGDRVQPKVHEWRLFLCRCTCSCCKCCTGCLCCGVYQRGSFISSRNKCGAQASCTLLTSSSVYFLLEAAEWLRPRCGTVPPPSACSAPLYKPTLKQNCYFNEVNCNYRM